MSLLFAALKRFQKIGATILSTFQKININTKTYSKLELYLPVNAVEFNNVWVLFEGL